MQEKISFFLQWNNLYFVKSLMRACKTHFINNLKITIFIYFRKFRLNLNGILRAKLFFI